MTKFDRKQIRQCAKQIIAANPGGIRFKTLVRQILTAAPDTPENSIRGSVYNLQEIFPDEIIKPSRGLFQMISNGKPLVEAPRPITIGEDAIYLPFADWLEKELDEVTKCVSLGGNAMKSKWGTPDVVGVYRATSSDLIKFPPEIVVAEIKVDPQQPVVAFGQAVAYRLFATKVYVAMPNTISDIDFDRLEALCILFGVGLVLFDPKPSPEFSIRVRAQRFAPDMFYVNEFAERLKQIDVATFKELFG